MFEDISKQIKVKILLCVSHFLPGSWQSDHTGSFVFDINTSHPNYYCKKLKIQLILGS